jgi:hypothetical protein
MNCSGLSCDSELCFPVKCERFGLGKSNSRVGLPDAAVSDER